MRILRLALGLGLLAGLPAAVAAQQGSCEIIEGSMASSTEIAPGQRMVRLAGPVHLQCTGGVTIRAADATNYEWTRELFLNGNVFYEDAEKRITADQVRRFGAEGRLVARGNVVVVDKESGAVVRGPDMVHQQAQGAAQARTVITGRPHATVPPRRQERGDSAAADTLEIDADWMELLGEDAFHAYGNVEFERGAHSGSSNDATFDQAEETIRLLGAARLWGEGFELRGDTVVAALQNQTLRQVDARVAAVLQTEELNVESAELRIYLEEGELERLVAVTRSDSARAVATARDFRLVADSIEAVAPAERLERVTAVGHAYGESTSDSVDLSLPELVRRDWLRGDTIIGHFIASVAQADGAPREGREEAVLERLIAIGGEGLARSLFRMADEQRPAGTAPQAINYFVARRITVAFRDGEVNDVQAEEQIRGVHLQPEKRRVAQDPPGSVADAGTERERRQE